MSLTTQAIRMTVELPPGWHYTAGWGTLATLIVAILALISSMLFNTVAAVFTVVTLRRTAAQFRQGRLDARNDKLRQEIAAYNAAAGERQSQLDIYLHRVGELVRALPAVRTPAKLEQFRQDLKAAFSETVSDVYRRTGAHSFAINILTDDPGILDHVNSIQGGFAEERVELEHVLSGSGQPSPTDAATTQRRLARDQYILREQKALLAYCIAKWGPQSR
jgi:hypothetical protein